MSAERRRHPNVGIGRRALKARLTGEFSHVSKTYRPVFRTDGSIERWVVDRVRTLMYPDTILRKAFRFHLGWFPKPRAVR